MGVILATILALATSLGLWRFGRLGKLELQLVGVALFLALAGYAWQGTPSLFGQQPAVSQRSETADSEFARTRETLLGRFNRASQWLTIADSYQRRGDTRSAVAIIRSGLRQNPRDSSLWTGLGSALVAHADGLLTPAAELAFARAEGLAPGHPGPRFYYGLALAQNGRFGDAEAIWREIVETAPPDAEYRKVVAERLVLLQRLQAAIEAQGRIPPGQ